MPQLLIPPTVRLSYGIEADRQGRITADILPPDGRQIAHELVKEGWPGATGRSGDQALKDMEELARAAGTGLWSG